jgi:hypothetical protein
MIGFKRMSLWQRLLVRFVPSEKKKYEASCERAIEHLMKHPEEPCSIEGRIILDGYGQQPGRAV